MKKKNFRMDTATLMEKRWFSIKKQISNMEDSTTAVNYDLEKYFSKMLNEDNADKDINLNILNDARNKLRTGIVNLRNALIILENELNEDEKIYKPITNGELALKIYATQEQNRNKYKNK